MKLEAERYLSNSTGNQNQTRFLQISEIGTWTFNLRCEIMSLEMENEATMKLQTDLEVADGTVVKRRFYTQSDFDLAHDRKIPTVTVRQEVRDKLKEWCTPSRSCCTSSLLSFFPFIGILKNYSVKNDLFGDVVSGLTVGVMHIPQGMAYGMLANLDPVYGLYTSFFPVIFYFFLGTSRHISLGTFAVVSLMLGVVIDKSDCCHLTSNSSNGSLEEGANGTAPSEMPLNDSHYVTVTQTSAYVHSDGDDYEVLMCKVGYVMAVTLLAGIYQLLLGILSFGFITIYLLDPLTRALTAGAAVHVFTSQIRHVLGISVESFHGPLKLIYVYIALFKKITSINFASLVMAIICIIIIYCAQRWLNPIVRKKLKVPLPIELIVLIFGTLISALAKFSSVDVFKMKVVGHIPTGFPPPAFPPINRLSSVAVDAIGISIVSFAINISMAKMFAQKHGYALIPNQELKAYGIVNILGSILNCYISTASLSRSVLQEAVGGKTQIAGLVSCCLLLVVLLAVGPLFRELPNCVLAAIIIVNLRNVFLQITDLPKLLKISLIDMLIWLVTFLSVVLTDVDLGLLVGVVFALFSVVFRTQRVHSSIVGQISPTDVYEDVKQYSTAKEVEGIKIFRFSASICFPNSDSFVRKLYKKTECDPVKIKASMRSATLSLNDSEAVQPSRNSNHQNGRLEEGVKSVCIPALSVTLSHVILDCACMVFIDSVGIDALKQVIDAYGDIGVKVSFAGCRESVYDLLKSTVCTKKDKQGNVIVRAKIYVTVQDAVIAATEC